jgi:hypothetical protein
MNIKIEYIKTINGNGQDTLRPLPRLLILGNINEGGLKHIQENTGLTFVPGAGGYEVQPQSSAQIVALFMTYDFKTNYNDNLDYKNTLLIKFDHHVGFYIDSICPNCAKENGIHWDNAKAGDRLAC